MTLRDSRLHKKPSSYLIIIHLALGHIPIIKLVPLGAAFSPATHAQTH